MPAIPPHRLDTAPPLVQPAASGYQSGRERIRALGLLSGARDGGNGLGLFQRGRGAQLADRNGDGGDVAAFLVQPAHSLRQQEPDSGQVVYNRPAYNVALAAAA